MAGAGWRQFTVGQLLTSAQVQTFMQDQSVQVHASAAARSSALGTAVSEGMVSYRTDGKALELYANSSWTPVIQGRNAVINGAFDIWQRGTSVTGNVNAYFAADRWFFNVSGSFTTSRQTTGVPAGSQYCMRVLANGAQIVRSIQFIETSESLKMAGKVVTAQVKIRRNSALTQDMSLAIQKSATVDAGIGATWDSISSVTITNASMPTGTGASNWYTATLTVTVPNDGTANSLRFYVESGTIPNGGYYELAEAQLEIGSVATPFVRAGGTLQGELAACQRYYQRFTGTWQASGAAGDATNVYVSYPLVAMRTTPTAIDYSGVTVGDLNNTNLTTSSVVINQASPQFAFLRFAVTGATQYRPYFVSGSGGGYIGISAEL